MASISLPKHSIPLLPTPTHKNSYPQIIPFLSRSSHSEIYGLKLSSVPTSPPPSSTTLRTHIYAKVSKGSVPPSFTLKDQDGKNVSLSTFKGKPVVVYFYPADESPGCTKQWDPHIRVWAPFCTADRSVQILIKKASGHLFLPVLTRACAFRDSYEKFKKAGAEVVGISGDDPSSHKSFSKKYKLPFTLLSDEGNKIRKEWGVPSDLFGTLPGRQTYVLDRNGVVQLIYNNQFQPEKHVDETLKLLQSL